VDLFSRSAVKDRRGQPLAERMRPRTLDEVVGQKHLLASGKLLRDLAAREKLPSLILWGPPGTGKTTLARVLAETRKARFAYLSAVTSGLPQLRELIAEAQSRRDQFGDKTILFLDEIHRFHKGQQDALLPHVEDGTVTLIGATTENPGFEVVSALLSRCVVLRLESLSEEDLDAVIRRALTDAERGLGKEPPVVDADAIAMLAREADGDARRALGALETAAELSRHVTQDVVEQALGRKVVRHDKGGEAHYDVVSAFIKSMRGSDPDAAVYWMARLIEAGEDPRFVVRRMVIFAAEDIGNADPRALPLATAALQAVELVGYPEAVLPMTQAALFLATAPKSNSVITAWSRAKEAVQRRGTLPVPPHLRNKKPGDKGEGHFDKTYKYPHDYPGHWVEQQYLPDGLADARFFEPSDQGYEKHLRARAREKKEPTEP
jgi:putative ATPase